MASKASKVKFTAINRFPAVHRDIALVVNEEVKAEQLMKAIKAAGKRMVKQVEVFDVYQGEHVESGKKSVAPVDQLSIGRSHADRSGNSGRASDGSGSSGKGLSGGAARLIQLNSQTRPGETGSLFCNKKQNWRTGNP